VSRRTEGSPEAVAPPLPRPPEPVRGPRGGGGGGGDEPKGAAPCPSMRRISPADRACPPTRHPWYTPGDDRGRVDGSEQGSRRRRCRGGSLHRASDAGRGRVRGGRGGRRTA